MIGTTMREKRNFAYFTGTNRPADVAMISTMIRSARACGVPEDFHVFTPSPIEGAIHHPTALTVPWKNHMAKVDFLRQMAASSYEFFVWLDGDNYFVRDPGDFSTLLRSNKCWVSSEGEINTGKRRLDRTDWWNIPWDKLEETYRQFGCHNEKIWNTNGGMFIVRRDAVNEFYNKAFSVWEYLMTISSGVADEPALAIACQSMIPDPQMNTIEMTREVWASDWGGRNYAQKLPDGKDWSYECWLNGSGMIINPAIVHAMGAKHLMRSPAAKAKASDNVEPVGTILKELLESFGSELPKGCDACGSWIQNMNKWGVYGCIQNRRAIIHRLVDASEDMPLLRRWLNMMLAAAHGYFTIGSIVDEAIKRAQIRSAS